MQNRQLAQNTTYLTVALAIQKVLSFVYFIFVARFIGVINTGKFSFAMSFTTIFAVFIDFGLTQILIRESARDKKNSQKYLSNILGLKLLISLFIYLVIVILINIMGYPEVTRNMVYVSAFVMLLDSFALTFYGVLRGHHNLKFESLGVIINQVVILSVGLMVLILNLGLVVLVSVYLLGSLFNLIYSSFILKLKLGIISKISFDRQFIIKALKLALPFAIAGIFIRLYSTMDIVLLSKMAGDEATGIYSVAYKITFAMQFIALAFSASLYPAFSTYFVQSKELLAKIFVQSMNYLMIIALPISVGVITIADKIIGPIFGQEYIASIIPLQIMISSLVLIFVCFPIGALLNACDKQIMNTVSLGITAISNIIFNIILIPIFSYNGSALASVLGYITLFTVEIIVINKIFKYNKKFLILSFLKILLSCLVMGIIVILLKSYLHFVPVIIIGALTYAVMIFLTKIVSKSDILQFKGILLKK